ncbi:MAG: ATP-binding protein [Paraburkholderia sp.]|uniref:ATP-binding protein n=2 Tax=Paraburkholderia sp. TaxID=1926495 RepID=UPI00397AF0D7
MKRPHLLHRSPISLRYWVGLRMSALAVGAVVSIAMCMWLRFAIWDFYTMHQIPASARPELEALRAAPELNQARLWELFQRYYNVRDFLPGVASRDWLLLAALVIGSVPLVVLGGLLASRPLSQQLSNVAQAAHKVTQGDFSARAPVVPGAPEDLKSLADDFNGMTAKLEQYEREVRDSSAVLAHELRTPLNAAMGRVQGMLDEVFPSDPDQLLMVKRQLDQLNRLVGDLHLLSLARAGQLAMEESCFNLNDLVSERLAWSGPQLNAAGISPQVRNPHDLTLTADRDRIGQVLSILIENLLRYAATGRSLEITATVAEKRLLLEISDRGPGVGQEELLRMFDRFWRAEHSRARPWGGNGLGLSIASAICDAHHGTVHAVNREGGGLAVRILLPLDRPASLSL